MSYTPTTWADNDVITVQKLNKMEQGLAEQKSEVFVINVSYSYNYENDSTTYLADKTYAEIKAALLAGKNLIIKQNDSIVPLSVLDESSEEYSIEYFYHDFSHVLSATSSDQLLSRVERNDIK